MADYYGDLDLKNGHILGLKVEVLQTTPAFDEEEEARLLFVRDEKALKINDGDEWITLQYSNNSSMPLIDTLGKQWINPDSSLNPDQFNQFHSITGLTSNDSLFTVLQKMDQAISKTNGSTFASLTDVHIANEQVGDVLYRTPTGYSNISLTNLAASRLSLNTSNLKDIKATAPFKLGQVYLWNDSVNAFVNKSIYFEYTNTAANTTFVVTHSLNKQHCFVKIIDLQTNKEITENYAVTFTNANQLTVTITPATGVKILVLAMPFSFT